MICGNLVEVRNENEKLVKYANHLLSDLNSKDSTTRDVVLLRVASGTSAELTL